jgi:hypothetical protein
MTNKRKTGNDYLTEYNELQNKVEVLKSKISNRLHDLCTKFPDVPVASMGDVVIKAKTINSTLYITSININDQIKYIQAIEEYNLKEQGFIQTTMWF